MKKYVPWVVGAAAVWVVWKCCNLPQVKEKPVYKPVTSPPVYDHLYQDARLTEVL